MKNPITIYILEILNHSRDGMTAKEIWHLLPDVDDFRTLHVTLSAMVKRGKARVDGKKECLSCHCAYTCYRITDEGRIHLRNKRTIKV